MPRLSMYTFDLFYNLSHKVIVKFGIIFVENFRIGKYAYQMIIIRSSIFKNRHISCQFRLV